MPFTFNKAAHTSVMKLLTKIFAETSIPAVTPVGKLPSGALRFEYIDRDLNSDQDAMDWICAAENARVAGMRLRLVLENQNALKVLSNPLSLMAHSKFTVDFANGLNDEFFQWWLLLPTEHIDHVASTLRYGKNLGYIPFYVSQEASAECFYKSREFAMSGHYLVPKIPFDRAPSITASGQEIDSFAKELFKEKFDSADDKKQMVLLGKTVVALCAWSQPKPGTEDRVLMCLGYNWKDKKGMVTEFGVTSVTKVTTFGAFRNELKQKLMDEWLNAKMAETLF